jgi:hypothetical protein
LLTVSPALCLSDFIFVVKWLLCRVLGYSVLKTVIIPVSCKLRSIFSNLLTQEVCGIDSTLSGLVISINRKRLGPLVSQLI